MEQIKRLLLAVLLLGAAHCTTAAESNPLDADSSEAALERQLDEERLAYQLYTALGELYPQSRPFQNIPKSEARHFDALKRYIEQHHPKAKAIELTGDFIFLETQDLYDQLYAKGQQNLAAAMEVGAAVERLDINDLDQALAITEDEQLKAIYQRLRTGSEHHLAAFSRQKAGGRQSGR
ncbi:MAG: DUF2202 domain-containing protein [Verrucomicrobia bacterium]|jgi:hypothetical protein|nr:DUF2202 domain-containing protein [Verrucomicrobiota bacterium]